MVSLNTNEAQGWFISILIGILVSFLVIENNPFKRISSSNNSVNSSADDDSTRRDVNTTNSDDVNDASNVGTNIHINDENREEMRIPLVNPNDGTKETDPSTSRYAMIVKQDDAIRDSNNRETIDDDSKQEMQEMKDTTMNSTINKDKDTTNEEANITTTNNDTFSSTSSIGNKGIKKKMNNDEAMSISDNNSWRCACENGFLPPGLLKSFGGVEAMIRMGSGQCYHKA